MLTLDREQIHDLISVIDAWKDTKSQYTAVKRYQCCNCQQYFKTLIVVSGLCPECTIRIEELQIFLEKEGKVGE
jgi:hypothetical protein